MRVLLTILSRFLPKPKPTGRWLFLKYLVTCDANLIQVSRKPRSLLELVAAVPVEAEEGLPLEEVLVVEEEGLPPEAVAVLVEEVAAAVSAAVSAAAVSLGEEEEEVLVEAGDVSRCPPLSCPFVFLRRSGKRELFDGIMCLNILLCPKTIYSFCLSRDCRIPHDYLSS